MTADQIHALAEAEKAALPHTAMGMDIADAAAVGMKVRAHYEKRIAALRDALMKYANRWDPQTAVEALHADDEAAK